jgi:hypothetical protein
MIVKGNVKIRMIGFIKAFKIPIIIVEIIREEGEENLIQGVI